MRTRFRLIKPEWAKAITDGADVLEGYFSEAEIKAKNKLGYNIYYFPNHPSEELDKLFLSGKDVNVFEYCFVDMDLKDGVYASKEEFIGLVSAFEPQPNRIIDSGNGIHAYWKITDLTRERYVELQLRLINKFKTDDSIYTVLQLMRYPGSFNTKKQDDFKLVSEFILNENEYTYEALSSVLEPISPSAAQSMEATLTGTPVQIADSLDLDTLPEAFISLLQKSNRVHELFYNEEPGTRSESDYALARELFEAEISKNDATVVLANTHKARSRTHTARAHYAAITVQKVYGRDSYVVSNAREATQKEAKTQKGMRIYGPEFFDGMKRGWRTQQVLGLVGPTGCGKSTVTLNMMKGILESNQDTDFVAVYFNLEMPEAELLEKWVTLAKEPALIERLYIVSNEGDDDFRHINLQKAYWYVKGIQRAYSKRVIAVAIDHVGCISPEIDIHKKPNFNMESNLEGAYKHTRMISPRIMPEKLKQLAIMLDTFLIIQSQTTKAKGGDGDVPLGLASAYGAAQFEHYVDYLMTIWRPLKAVQFKTKMGVVGFKYCKIRAQDPTDSIKVDENKALFLDMYAGELRYLDEDEWEIFSTLNREASVLRKKAEKQADVEYQKMDISKLAKLKIKVVK